jgi:prevent-host-death family protein
MDTFGAFEAKTHFSALLEKVEQGEEIIITKHGKAIAKLVPLLAPKISAQEAVNHLKQFQIDNALVLGMDWKTLRDEGRK